MSEMERINMKVNDSMGNIQEVSYRLERTKGNLQRIREQYKNEPELLSIHEPLGVYLINKIESRLNESKLGKELD
ncbi:MAG TPA: hypothetical protein VGI33_03100 [Paenibacillus sp.]|jgi:hypothetical protein